MSAVPGQGTVERPASAAVWLGFGAMTLGMFMAVLDIQIVVTSLPTISTALAIPADRMSWVQTAYLIAEVIAIPLTGLLTRVLSLRVLFAAALALFTAASLACAASGGFESLIAARVIQGFAGGVLIPSVFSAVFLLFPVRQQGLATTLGGVMAVLAPTVGPLIGGWITQTFSWHWLFLVNVGPGIAAVAVAARCLPREAGEYTHARRVDLLGLLLMAASLAALEIGLKDAPRHGWASLHVLGLLAVFVLCGGAFVRRSLGRMHRQMREPPIPRRMPLAGLRQRIVIVPSQRDPRRPRHQIRPRPRHRQHLHADPARIHIRDPRLPKIRQLRPLGRLRPDKLRPGKPPSRDGFRRNAGDDAGNGIVFFEGNEAHLASSRLVKGRLPCWEQGHHASELSDRRTARAQHE